MWAGVWGSDVHGPAQSRKPAGAGSKKAEPDWAVVAACDGSRLRLRVLKAESRGLSCGFQVVVVTPRVVTIDIYPWSVTPHASSDPD
jgi:hypothetical protein